MVLTLDILACQYHYLSHVLYILLTSTLLVFVSLAVSSLRDRTQRLPPPALVTELPVRHLRGVREEGPGSERVGDERAVQLEEQGDRPLRPCLEERDWIPGRPVVDNLWQSIHQSKRTVFVLTNHDGKSGNFKTLFYMAHQRLMDEENDIIVLIFLEKAASNSKYLRLKKRLYRLSVMEWLTNPQAQPYFWFGLSSMLATESKKQNSDMFREML